MYDPVINANNYTTAEWLFTARPGLFGLIGGCANPTGIALVVILLVMFICSQPFVRRGGSFEVLSIAIFPPPQHPQIATVAPVKRANRVPC